MTAVYRNLLQEALPRGRFAITLELTTPAATQPPATAMEPLLALAGALRDEPRITAIALTDRSNSDHDLGAIDAAHRIAEASGKTPLLHWAGKDRSGADLETDLQRAITLGLENVLLVTGDKVHHPPPDRPIRYLDSVNALALARRLAPGALLVAAVCPFKYREEELLGQYLKAGKKLRAGADLLMTQIGWDMPKFEEARWFLAARGYAAPLMAELLYLTAARARRIRHVGLPGVTITDDLVQLLEAEEAGADRGRTAAHRRLALQIVGVRHFGYVGVQITGLHAAAGVITLLETLEACERECPTLDEWRPAWRAAMTTPQGAEVVVAPPGGLYLMAGETAGAAGAATVSSAERTKFKVMDLIHRAAFADGAVGARLLGRTLGRMDSQKGLGGLLLTAERAIKGPLVGCATCGFCRLPETAYVCPETCPKGLANGPCGGTRDNWCEFGDRECIHNRIYRISKDAGLLSNLEEVLIPPVPESDRESCSWVTHFQKNKPTATRLTSRSK